MSVHPGFRDLYEREFDRVFRAVYVLAGDRALAEDATQEAFARALARWRRIGAHPSPAGWVTTTALNVARRQLRRAPHPTPTGEAGTNDDDERLAVREAIRVLPPRQQEAVILHYLVDLPVADVAAAMGIDEGTVKTHLFRARTAIATALADPVTDPTQELTP